MRWSLTKLASPTRYLTLVNVLLSGLGFVQSVWVARALSLEALGVIAVITGVNVTALNFLDVRLTDLASRLYYQPRGAAPAYRASVLMVCLAGNLAISLALGVVGVIAGRLALPALTPAVIPGWWLAAQAALLGAHNLTNTVNTLQRFSERFYFFGTTRLVIRVGALAVFGGLFLADPSVDGYYLAGLVSAVLTLAASLLVTAWAWGRWDGLPWWRWRALGLAWPDYAGQRRFLFFGNLLGYTKLFHRAADVLVVGWLANDQVTGLYKFVRSLTDTLYVVFDALNQVHQPRFMAWLAAGQALAYRALARRLVLAAAAATLALVGLGAVVLPWALPLVFGDKFRGAEPALLIMTVPFLFVTGVHLWLWPLFVHAGQLGRFTLLNVIAVAAQYLTLGLAFIAAGPSAAGAAWGYLMYYVILYPLAVALAWARFRTYLPGTVAA